MLVRVSDSSEVSAARRATTSLAQGLGLDEQATGRAALVVTELATNLLKHGGGGQILLDRYRDAGGSGLELQSLDKGPGIADLGRAMTDGYSSVGSMGTGLGAIRRQSDDFAVYSRPGQGTAIVARIRDPAGPSFPAVIIGVALIPLAGEPVSGDSWAFAGPEAGPTLMAIDGSGHGSQAETAARAAAAAFERNAAKGCVTLLEAMHGALASTRGGAVAVARIDRQAGQLRYAGVGNISGAMVCEGRLQRMVSHNGVLGHIVPRIREFTYPCKGEVTVILHSDGVSARWDLETYPGLAVAHPSLIAGVLLRDFGRARDDACVVVMRVPP